MSVIGNWLEREGLGKYAELFEQNELTVELLPELTDDDLRELGLPMGPRKQLLKLVKNGIKSEPADEGSGAGSVPADEAERRQLTVMFADLVGSTELSVELDPEELRRLNRSYQDTAKTAVERYGGYVARYMGDGVLAYFGYPVAYEDASARAILAGLDLNHSVAEIEGPHSLSARVGVATGPVVVGDIVGEGASQENAVVGEAPNLAARLQALAPPGTVVVSEHVLQLSRGLFETEDLGDFDLKGFKAPVRAFRVVRTLQVQSRFAAGRARSLTRLIGREDELSLLVRRWNQAKDGEGRFVSVCGEPGVGKSRLLEELYIAITADEHIAIRCQCSPHTSNTPFLPIIHHVERAAEILADDDGQVRLQKLSSFVEREGADSSLTPLLATLFSLPAEELADLAPRRRRDMAIDGLVDDVIRLSRERPVLFVLEDAHWADASTLEVLERLFAAGESHRVLTLVTHRPEFSPPWAGQGTNTQIFLNRLGRSETRALLASTLGVETLDADLVDQLVERCDGVPLFAEELAKGALARTALEIPVTLQDFLMARLDRLGQARDVAQTAACIGREFSADLLAKIVDIPGARLEAALDDLIRSEIVYPHHRRGKTSHFFKHALLRDAAYESLLLERRRPIHLRIAGALEADAHDVIQVSAELAHHYELAGEAALSAEHFASAAGGALAAFSIPEALALYVRAIAALGGTDARTEIALRLNMARAHHSVSSFDEAWQEAAEAKRLAERVGDEKLEGRAVATMAQMSLFGHNFARCEAECERALALSARAENDSQIAASAWTWRSLLFACQGKLGDSRAGLDTALGHCQVANDKDSESVVRVISALHSNWRGDFAEAAERSAQAALVARKAKSQYPLVIALFAKSLPLVGGGRYDAAYECLQEGIKLSERLGEEFQYVRYFNTLGWLKAEIGGLAEAQDFNQRGLEIAARRRDPETVSNCLLNIADVHIARNEVAEALDCLKEVHGIVHKPSTSDWLKWRYSMHMLASYGEAQLARGDLSAAKELCRQCLVVATATESKKYLARGWRLKAGLAKARLEWDEANTALDQSLAFATKVGNPTQLWRTHLARAEVLKRIGRSDEAEAAYHAAGRTIADIGASLSTPALKALFEGSTLIESIRTQIAESR